MPLLEDCVYIIAEFGSNHNGALKQCELAVKEAAGAGCDAVKFQLFKLGDILIDTSRGREQDELPPDYLPKIADYCREYGIDFLCTPFSADAVRRLDEYVQMWKIGSFEHGREDIWNACRATGKPIIASKGRANVSADYTLRCISVYPAFPSEYDLSPFGENEGISDHTTSTVLAALAVMRGACIVEKHFKLDSTPETTPDYPHSLNPARLAEMVDNIRLAELTCRRQPPAERTLIEYPNRRE